MRVSYPLSLKVSLWLMLNLLLLAALGIGFFVAKGGLRWDALVAGPTGERLQTLANVIAGEAAATSSEARTALLKRFGEAYGADIYLFHSFDEVQTAGAPVTLPDEVRARVGSRGLRLGPPGGFGSGERKGFGPRGDSSRAPGGEYDPARRRDSGEKSGRENAEREPPPRDPAEKGRSGPELGRRDPPPGGPLQGPALSEILLGRFVVRAGTPAAYWVGLRVQFQPPERTRPIPTRMVIRIGSLWGLLQLLNLQPWLLAGSVVLALSVIFWLPLVRSITRSIGQLTAATEQIAEGRFDTRVVSKRRDELGNLGASVNRMAARLDAHMSGQKRFLGDVAHELCSPLARLQMATGILTDQAPPALQATVGDVREEVQQMSTLVNELLAFTKAGMQARDVALTPTRIESVAREALEREDAAGRVTVAVDPELHAMAEPALLGRAIGNLVRNAVRYAGDAGPISLTATRSGKQVSIALEDDGPGVPPGDIDRLGEPFFRPDLARTREGGGVGLGLAIVRNSIAACGGEVRFANRNPRGFRAEIRLTAA
jgi:two-component system sensor histidine kinase CpxA